MYINASDENSVDAVRDKIRGFAATIGFRKWKIIILDESDYLTPNAQAALRNLMETFSTSTRFILTCNYVEKVIDPIQSRCQTFGITPPSKKEVAIRMKDILDSEEVKYEMSDLVTLVNDKASTIQANYMDEVLTLLKSNGSVKDTFQSVRKVIADSKVKDFTPFYRFMYDSVDEYADGKVGNTILKIADGQYKDASVVDKEINIMAMMLEIIIDIKQ